MAIQVTEVQKALKGVDYPTSSEDLATTAESNGADEEVVVALRDLEGNEFDGPDNVMHALKGRLGND